MTLNEPIVENASFEWLGEQILHDGILRFQPVIST